MTGKMNFGVRRDLKMGITCDCEANRATNYQPPSFNKAVKLTLEPNLGQEVRACMSPYHLISSETSNNSEVLRGPYDISIVTSQAICLLRLDCPL